MTGEGASIQRVASEGEAGDDRTPVGSARLLVRRPKETRIVVSGEIDAAVAPQLETTLTTAASTAGRNIFVDLAEVTLSTARVCRRCSQPGAN